MWKDVETQRKEFLLPSIIDIKTKPRITARENSLYKTFCRLADPNQPVSVARQAYLDRTGPCFTPSDRQDDRSITPLSGHSKRCMCYDNVMHYVKRVCCNSAAWYNPYNNKETPSKWMKISSKRFAMNQSTQLPLSSLIVRWQIKRQPTGYDQRFLQAIFSKYGDVREIRLLSENSALVVFEELKAACDAMRSAYIGLLENKLHCRWWHKSMETKVGCRQVKGVQIKPVKILQDVL